MKQNNNFYSTDLISIVKNLPQNSGVYLMRDKQGNILYIGKAKNLRKRVQSYFVSSPQHSHRIALMVKQI
jgi:excinuclease ABC subunit C